jgi:hypothetical protein
MPVTSTTRLSRFEDTIATIFFLLMLVFSSFLAFPPQRNDVCSRTNIAFYVPSYLLLSSLSLKNTQMQSYGNIKNAYDAIECSLFF